MTLYLNDTYLLECASIITSYGRDEKGPYLLLRETIFYPQGGGQPADNGVIKTINDEIPVIFVRQSDKEIRHYIAAELELHKLTDTEINCVVDAQRRILNARYHTAAHLLGNVVEHLYRDLKAVKGHSFPGEAYVEFTGDTVPDADSLVKELSSAIEARLATTTFEMTPTCRAMRIGDFPPVPCGGTHLRNTAEIGDFNIRKISRKGDRLKISYELI